MPLGDTLAWRNAATYEKNSADGDAMSLMVSYKTSLLRRFGVIFHKLIVKSFI